MTILAFIKLRLRINQILVKLYVFYSKCFKSTHMRDSTRYRLTTAYTIHKYGKSSIRVLSGFKLKYNKLVFIKHIDSFFVCGCSTTFESWYHLWQFKYKPNASGSGKITCIVKIHKIGIVQIKYCKLHVCINIYILKLWYWWLRLYRGEREFAVRIYIFSATGLTYFQSRSGLSTVNHNDTFESAHVWS